MLCGVVDFAFILLGTLNPERFANLADPIVVHTLRATNSLRILRTCRLFKGRWDKEGCGMLSELPGRSFCFGSIIYML